MFRSLFRRRARAAESAAGSLYARAVERARDPAFYGDIGVADTLDGRFDMVALHVYLLLRRLKRAQPPATDLSQALFDLMFRDMDESLRELGAGDLGVGRRVKAMAKAMYGRIAAYDAALASAEPGALEEVLCRNVYRGRAPSPGMAGALAAYVRAAEDALARQPDESLRRGEARLPPVPPPPRRSD